MYGRSLLIGVAAALVAAAFLLLLVPYGALATGVVAPSRSISAQVGPSQATVYPVNFTESGLPGGTSWSVTLNGTTGSSTSTLTEFNESNGSYGYSVGSVAGYRVAPSGGTVNVTGSATAVALVFTALPPTVYPVDFTEHGLPGGSSWSVTLNGTTLSSTTTTVQFNETNGTYAYSIPAVTGYVPSANSGNVSVNGNSASVQISFSKAPPTVYPVTFSESGLPSGTRWAALIGGDYRSSTTSTIVYNETNGSYSFTVTKVGSYVPDPAKGSVSVNGGGASQSVVFTIPPKPLYPVTFGELGLPLGVPWSVTFNGTSRASTTASIGFNATNGSYSFSLGLVAGFTASPESGTVNVNGRAASESIGFTRVNYTITFAESGLPSGTLWAVTLDGALHSSNHLTMTFAEPNGTYAFSVTSIPGYRAAPGYGNLTVNGPGSSVDITFLSPASYSVAFTAAGLVAGTTWGVTLGTHRESTSASSLFFGATNGTYAYVVQAPTGYTVHPSGGTVNITGKDAGVGLVFSHILGNGTGLYAVRFLESGLPAGTAWGVDVNGTAFGSNTTLVELNATNGSYPYVIATVAGYFSEPVGGNLSVNGSAVWVNITFGLGAPPPTYVVTFAQVGLPPGVVWSVTFNGAWNQTADPTMTFVVPNGTYNYTVHKLPGYDANVGQDQITINGTPRSVHVTYRQTGGGSGPNSKVGGLSNFDWAVIGATAVVVIGLILGYLFTRGPASAPTPRPRSDRVPRHPAQGQPDRAAGTEPSSSTEGVY